MTIYDAGPLAAGPLCGLLNQEDVNGEKLTVKTWWIFGADFLSRFGADFFTVYADFSRFIRDINGENKKHLVIDELFHG